MEKNVKNEMSIVEQGGGGLGFGFAFNEISLMLITFIVNNKNNNFYKKYYSCLKNT